MIAKLLTEHHLEFLCLQGGCRGSSDSTHVKMPHCWKSHATAHIMIGHGRRIVNESVEPRVDCEIVTTYNSIFLANFND